MVFVHIWHRSDKLQERIFYPHFFLIMFVPNTSKSFCLLMLSVTLLREVHWAASSVVFKMFLHFWPCFSGTKVFLSTTSLMPGFYRWLLNTAGSPLEALSPLKPPCCPLIPYRAAEALVAHTLQWHRLERDRQLLLCTRAQKSEQNRKSAPSCFSAMGGCTHCTASSTVRSKSAWGKAKSLKPCLHVLTLVALGIN